MRIFKIPRGRIVNEPRENFFYIGQEYFVLTSGELPENNDALLEETTWQDDQALKTFLKTTLKDEKGTLKTNEQELHDKLSFGHITDTITKYTNKLKTACSNLKNEFPMPFRGFYAFKILEQISKNETPDEELTVVFNRRVSKDNTILQVCEDIIARVKRANLIEDLCEEMMYSFILDVNSIRINTEKNNVEKGESVKIKFETVKSNLNTQYEALLMTSDFT